MAVTAQDARADTNARSDLTRAGTVRCNAPQRMPKAPDTPWGRLRGARGWSLRELEARTGINAGVLSRIERGTSPTPDQARALLAVYDGAR
jgi:hypothetical protein